MIEWDKRMHARYSWWSTLELVAVLAICTGLIACVVTR